MKNTFKILGLIAFAAIIGLSLFACKSPIEPGVAKPIDSGGTTIRSVNKYEADSYVENEKIRYSYSYENFDYYYFYLGELKNIPVFSYAARYHDGIDSTYKVSITQNTLSTIRQVVTGSNHESIGVINEHTKSKTTGWNINGELSTTAGISGKISDLFEIGAQREAKIGGGYHNDKTVSDTATNSSLRSKSLEDTIEHATTYTISTMEEDQFHFSGDNKAGYYRFTLFSASDVYLYVIRNSQTGDIYYEFMEHVIPTVYFWRMDYSEIASFRKSDATGFEFNSSLLNNLPKPGLVLAPDSLSGFVEIMGTVQEGIELRANIVDSNCSNIKYSWKRNGSTDIGNDNYSYTIQSGDVGSTISVEISCPCHAGGLMSNPTDVIIPLPPVAPISLTGMVAIRGTALVGQTLNANTNNLGGNGTISYKWWRNYATVVGTGDTYTLQHADAYSTITVEVTRSENIGYIESVKTDTIKPIEWVDSRYDTMRIHDTLYYSHYYEALFTLETLRAAGYRFLNFEIRYDVKHIDRGNADIYVAKGHKQAKDMYDGKSGITMWYKDAGDHNEQRHNNWYQVTRYFTVDINNFSNEFTIFWDAAGSGDDDYYLGTRIVTVRAGY